MAISKRFVVSYQGAADYDVDGKRYEVRTFADPRGPWAAGVFDREIFPMVGCVRNRDGDVHEFPPADVVALFPGYVAARFREDWTVEYQGVPPYVRLMPSTGYFEVAL